MTTYVWPTKAADPVLWPRSMEVRKASNTLASESPLSKSLYSVGRLGDRWGISVVFKANQTYAERARVEGFIARLNGLEHRVQLWDFARPTPAGSINLAGVTASAAAQFADAITLNGCGNAATLKMGDWFGVTTANGFQVLMCAADATASVGGVMAVSFTARLRGAVAAGAAVTLDSPKAAYLLEPGQDLVSPRDPQGVCPEFGVNFIEVF